MSLTVKNGGTSSVTGGTDMVFTVDPIVIPQGIHMQVIAEENFLIRPYLVMRCRMPALQRDGSYSKMKNSLTYGVPMLDSNTGKYVQNLIRIEQEVHPALSASNAATLRGIGAQLLYDSELLPFWQGGSIAF